MESLIETCQVRRGGIPLVRGFPALWHVSQVSVSFVHTIGLANTALWPCEVLLMDVKRLKLCYF